MISLYRPGNGLLHRLPVGPKLVLLGLVSFWIGTTGTTPGAVGVSLIAVATLFVVAGFGLSTFIRQLGALRWVLIATLLPLLLFASIEIATMATSRVVLVISTCALLAMTTPVPALLETVERVLTPVKRYGIDPTIIALTLALTLTSIPTIIRLARQVNEVWRSRGGSLWSIGMIVPLLVASLRHADRVAEAIGARGVL